VAIKKTPGSIPFGNAAVNATVRTRSNSNVIVYCFYKKIKFPSIICGYRMWEALSDFNFFVG
jgi:hypothetical protein